MTPDEITALKAHQLANDNAPEWLEEARRFLGTHEDLDGDVDHWQGGEGFNGPKPSKEDKNRDAYMKALEDVFVTEDLISEVVERRKNAVLGQSPELQVMMPGSEAENEEDGEDEETPADRAQTLLDDWWDWEDLTDRWEDVLERISSEEETLLRIVVDDSIKDEEGNAAPETIEEAMQAIRIELIGRDQGLVHEDIRTKTETGVIAFQRAEEADTGEVDYVEKTYRTDDGETALRIEYESGTDLPDEIEPVQETTFDLGGRLMHYQVEENLLVSESMRSNQKDLNTKRTLITITGNKAGFPELHAVNVLPPEDEDGEPTRHERGPGKIQYHVSVPKKAQGPGGTDEERSGGADVFESDPVDNESLRKDANVARRSIYRSAQQLHVFLADGTASGVSRVQSRHDHVSDVEDVAEKLDRAGEWAMGAAYHLAVDLLGRVPEGYPDPAEAQYVFHCNVDPGPVTPETKKEIRTAQREGFLSLKTALLKYGVDDPEEEIERLREEQQRQREQDVDTIREMAARGSEETRWSIEEGAETGGDTE